IRVDLVTGVQTCALPISSFFVSIYLKDAHSTTADLLLSRGARPFITPLHFAEWAHAIAQQVFRRQMTTAEANRVHQELHDDRTEIGRASCGKEETARGAT